MSLDSSFEDLASSYLMPNYARQPVCFVRGSGAYLYDDQGNEYLDFLSGISVCNLGHSHPAVVAAASEQLEKLDHVTNLYYSEPMLELAQKLSDSSLQGKVFFCNSGTEANEAALKLARKHKQGGEVVVFEDAFHGRTYGSLSATPQPAKQEPFAPLVPGFKVVAKEVSALEAAVGEQTAAVILEPVQGETGVNILPLEVIKAARELCDRFGALLIFDEIQCGLGRTGSLWAYQELGVKPDLLTTAKALANGLPIGALIAAPKVSDVFAPGDHGTTFGGGPVVCAAALATFNLISRSEILTSVKEAGTLLTSALEEIPGISNITSRGLMIGFDIASSAPELVKQALLEERLVINATGPNRVRLLPPLTITEPDLLDGIGRMRSLIEG